ncbi:MAG: RpiB/LacA/LacB family sugar-phosphate isomerase [Synergistaceae bacterium]|nr:RpiB/LacA/LacB family sugar-phosphate isomerase [Synergistaceae bacterium]
MVPIVLGCDSAAVSLKDEILALLKMSGSEVEDLGVQDTSDDTPYPLVAERVARSIIDSGYLKKGILICGTGIGMAIAANKFPGIHAAQVSDVYSAERACLSNNANVITLGARTLGPELAKRLVSEWLQLKFVPGRSSEKIEAIKEIERRNFRHE